MNNLKSLSKLVKGKEIIVINTKKNKIAFHLAHVLRDCAKRTYCIDKTYKIKESSLGIRSIEKGKVYLIKGDWRLEKYILLDRIKKILNGKPKLFFEVSES